MKVKEAKELLKDYSGEELYQKGRALFREEVNNLITLRSGSEKPTKGVIDSAITQVEDWFIKVAIGLPWPKPKTAKNIISWESGRIWIEYGFVDPKIEEYGKRARLEMWKGTPLPLLEALTPGALDAISSMMMGKLQVAAELYSKREEFAKGMGKKVCSYGVEERFCKYQETYSMATGIPSYIEDCVFICSIDKCYKEKK